MELRQIEHKSDSRFESTDNTSYGLDFGSYRSIMAYKERDRDPETARYTDACAGGIPSEFWYDENGDEHVGDEVIVQDGHMIDPDGQCQSIKMKLDKKRISLHGRVYNVEEIGEKLVKRIKEVTYEVFESELIDTDIRRLVAGVPVRYNAAVKGTIQSIIAMGMGLTKEDVTLIAEPILAAIAVNYFLNKKNPNATSRPLLVFDMGHGTFDVAFLEPNNNPYEPPYEVVSSDGSMVAGSVCDKIMAQYIISQLKKNPGTVSVASLEDPDSSDYLKLMRVANEKKELLSKTESCTALISDSNGGAATVTLKRSEYEELLAPEIKSTIDLAAEVVKKANRSNQGDFDILLIGGSTYIPLITKMLKEKFFWLSSNNFKQYFPERAVALGAAIYAETPDIITAKTAYGYAVNTYHKDKVVLDVIIPSNEELPVTMENIYYTRADGQTGVSFTVYELETAEEGELYDPGDGDITPYRITHNFGQPVPKNTKVELTTTLTESSTLVLQIYELDEYGNRIGKPTVKDYDIANTEIK